MWLLRSSRSSNTRSAEQLVSNYNGRGRKPNTNPKSSTGEGWCCFFVSLLHLKGRFESAPAGRCSDPSETPTPRLARPAVAMTGHEPFNEPWRYAPAHSHREPAFASGKILRPAG